MKLLKSILLTVAALSTVSALTGCASDAELIAGCNRGDVSSCRSLAASRAAARSLEGYALSGGDSMATGAYVANPDLQPEQMQAVREQHNTGINQQVLMNQQLMQTNNQLRQMQMQQQMQNFNNNLQHDLDKYGY